MEYHFITQKDGTLKPYNKETFETILKLAEGTFVRATFISERNPRHSAKYWALMEFGYQHLNDRLQIQSREELSHVLQYFLAKDGHKVAGRFIPLKSGEYYFERASLSFGAMSQEAFSEYYDLAINKLIVWLNGVGLGITRDELEQNSEMYYMQ